MKTDNAVVVRVLRFNSERFDYSLLAAKFVGAALAAIIMVATHSRLKPLLQHDVSSACCGFAL